ncbi:hypothetical protein [Burkholderia sp. Bp9031]|uniref:hypothetical protein n=1 Tax=Burkholderia sp. Bp9031 TaxID=2184566 RepID=UPI000F5EFC19|nr:hypothetical protein [Burkholderia sp. Bp9031]
MEAIATSKQKGRSMAAYNRKSPHGAGSGETNEKGFGRYLEVDPCGDGYKRLVAARHNCCDYVFRRD